VSDSMLLATAGCSGCAAATPYKRLAIAYTTTSKFARFVESFDRALARYAKAEDARCTAAATTSSTLDQAAYAKCMRPTIKLLVAWTGQWKGQPSGKGVLPTIQDAQRATRMSLDAAFDYVQANESACGKQTGQEAKRCADRVAAWRKVLRPGLCALVTVVDRAVKIGAYKTTQDSTYQLVRGLATKMCKGGK